MHGETEYGDNVGDLWFITYLLRKLARSFTECVVKYVTSELLLYTQKLAVLTVCHVVLIE